MMDEALIAAALHAGPPLFEEQEGGSSTLLRPASIKHAKRLHGWSPPKPVTRCAAKREFARRVGGRGEGRACVTTAVAFRHEARNGM